MSERDNVESKFIVRGGVPSPGCCALILRAVLYMETYGWNPMKRKVLNGARDIEGALEAADGDQYPTTSADFRMAVAAICRKLSYGAPHMWEYDEGRYRNREEVIQLLRSVALEGAA